MTIHDILSALDYGPSPESAAPATAWLAARAPGIGHFIDGAFDAFTPGASFVTENPATGAPLIAVSQGTGADVDRAVAAARAAFPGWSARPAAERARHLYALARAVQKHERFLAVLETIDTGKPIRESRDIDLPLVARHLHHHAGWAAALPMEFPGHAPHGVCAQVIPWNFPLLMLAWKVAPALAAGNTVVLKPAEQTPLTATAFAEICAEAGLPPGVVNIVQGDGDTGAALAAHPDVDKVAFTGSTDVGRAIRAALAGSGKALTLELGGKSPFIVFDSADLDAAVEGVVDGLWLNQGQVCCAGSRLLVQESVAEAFTARLLRRMETLRVGDPLDKGTDLGAIISAGQRARIGRLIDIALAEGGTLATPDAPLPDNGHWCAPGILAGAAPAATIAQVEVFGPIGVLMTFRTPAEAVEMANNTPYGLAASIWAQDLDTALDAAARVRAGVVWINGANLLDAAAPFGGTRESGFGREGGRAGMAAYLRPDGAAPTRALPDRPVDFAAAPAAAAPAGNQPPGIDRTLKLYIGGKQVRPDGGASYGLRGPTGARIGAAATGGRKDIRNAVEAAHKAAGWAALSGHARAQVVHFMAETLAQRREQFAASLAAGGCADPGAEVEATLDRLMLIGGMADKLDGAIPSTRARHLTLAMPEPWGVVGLICPLGQPLIGMVTLIAALIAQGNRVVAVPDPAQGLVAGDLAQLCDSSDVPGGVVNLITGDPAVLGPVLAAHDAVDALWHAGDAALLARLEAEAAGNLKPVRVHPATLDWAALPLSLLRSVIADAVQIKTVWLPYGA
ncbi:aldehyde dehydrogenase family protein [Paracoccus endophyticus]|uniref:aldehyde dehydrogenase family protein n=1 Tax=Paracoccus endophyticus TaxID=2233774 RepID=UPI000DD8F17F|nr:aldehyde dehydrogenase family protein [Paracoccus endophyticus]